MTKYQEKVLDTQYKKAKSIISNAMYSLNTSNDISMDDYTACFSDSVTGANRSTCLQGVSSKIFKITSDSIGNPSLLTDLKGLTYKTAYFNNSSILIPSAYAAGCDSDGIDGYCCNDTGDFYTSYSDLVSSGCQRFQCEGSDEFCNAGQETNPWDSVSYAFKTQDGMIFGYEADVSTTNDTIDGFYMVADINDTKDPNTRESDFRRFKVSLDGKVRDTQ